jgi:hypothetical protein
MRRPATHPIGLAVACLLAITAGPAPPVGSGRVIRVGPGENLKTPSQAAAAVRDGDIVEIEAGTYRGDAAVWRADRLTLRAAGGRVRLVAAGAHAEGKAIWVIKGRDTTVEGIEFLGARVPNGNGAGIRHEGVGLTLRRCRFEGNENGILTSGHEQSDVLVEHSEFAANGAGDGLTHNLYIGGGRRFTLRFSYVHHALVGHNVKTRATESHILYNRIMDEETGRSSYAVDIPNGGLAVLIGNLIQQGPATENSTIVAYGAEGLKHAVNELYVVNNTVVNDRPQGGVFVAVHGHPGAVRIVNNILAGRGVALRGPGTLSHNLTGAVQLRAPAAFDYRLVPGSPAIDAGVDPGVAHGVSLVSREHYVHPAGREPRPQIGPLDIGAYEYTGHR